MDKKAQIKEKLKAVVGVKPNLPLTAEVTAVSGYLCSVKLSTGLVLTDVRLNATATDSENGLTAVPKIGSDVIVISQTGELSGLIVIKVNEVDKLIYKQDDFVFEVDAITKKVTIKNAQANVGALIGQMIDTVRSAQVIVPGVGTGTIDPATQSQLMNIKTMFNSILNAT